MQIITGAAVFTNDDCGSFYDPGAIVFDRKIIAVGREDSILGSYPDLRPIRLKGGLITPGLVNLHHHFYSAMARGWNPNGGKTESFEQILEKIWWRLDEALGLEDIYFSAISGICESILAGVTAIADHHSSQKTIRGSLDKIAGAFALIGARGSICFELSGRRGKSVLQEGIEETAAALRFYADNETITPMVGLHASMTLADDDLEFIAESTERYRPAFHFHLAESEIDQTESLRKSGVRAAARFARYGLINEKSLAVHGVHLDSNELDILRSAGATLVVCPRSNQNNAVGCAPWWNYDGLRIGIGTDGIDSNLLQETRAALYVARLLTADPDFGFANLEKILLKNCPGALNMISKSTTGGIIPGQAADFVHWPYDPPTPVGRTNVWGHYLYGLADRKAGSVWVDGKPVLADGRFVNFDYEAAMLECRQRAARLWERV